MATKESQAAAANPFRRVRIKPRLKGSNTQHPSGGTVYPSGRTALNAAATDGFRSVASARGLDPVSCAVQIGVDSQTGVVAIYPVDPKAANAAAVRWTKDKRLATLYLVDVFDEVPELAPSARRQCAVSEGADPSGERCLFLSLNVSLIKRAAGSRKETAPATSTNK